MEFFGGEALIYTKFFMGKPIFCGSLLGVGRNLSPQPRGT